MRHLFLAIVISLVGVVNVYAEDDLKLCAAVLPCDGEGGVLEGFKGGECEAVYAEMCANVISIEHPGRPEQRISQCKAASKKKDNTIRELKRELRRAKLALAN